MTKIILLLVALVSLSACESYGGYASQNAGDTSYATSNY